MARLYSSRLIAAQLVGGGTALAEYTVPANKVVVVRTVTIVNTGGGGRFGWGLEVGSGALTSIYTGFFTPASAEQQYLWTGRHVIVAGEKLFLTTLSGNAYCAASGYLLDGA